jgi:hypothetical protein
MASPLLAKNTAGNFIAATKVDGQRRPTILFQHFPSSFVIMESSVYGFTDKVCKDCLGGSWEFYELSNGGFYMAPSRLGLIDVDVPFGNLYNGKMSADALGITVCLFAYNFLAEEHPACDFGDLYWLLRTFARNHAEASAIFAAID